MFKKKSFSLKSSELANFLNQKLYGEDIMINSYSSIDKIKDNSVIFLTDTINEQFNLKEDVILKFTKSNDKKNLLFILEKKFDTKNFRYSYILSDNPRFDFNKILNQFFVENEFSPGIHPSTIIEKNVELGENVYIGPNCYISSDVKIGKETQIFSNVTIHGKTIIGKKCVIKSNSVIGGEGFGFARNKDEIIHFPHTGQLTIGDNVWIGSNSTIDKGTIDETFIGNNVKIDDLVHIGHNSRIGSNTTLTVGSIICGRVIISESSWVSPNAIIQNGVKIGSNCLIGTASIVRKDIDNDCVVSGNPPRVIRKNIKKD